MKRAEHILEVPLPGSFGEVIAESSRADLRMLESGTAFVESHRMSDVDTALLVTSTSQFLRSTLKRLEGRTLECWLIIADTTAEDLAEMLEDNDHWALDARVDEPQLTAFRIRPTKQGDRALTDMVVGLRLAHRLDSMAPSIPVSTTTAISPEVPTTLQALIKRRIPRRAKTLVKKALARR